MQHPNEKLFSSKIWREQQERKKMVYWQSDDETSSFFEVTDADSYNFDLKIRVDFLKFFVYNFFISFLIKLKF